MSSAVEVGQHDPPGVADWIESPCETGNRGIFSPRAGKAKMEILVNKENVWEKST